MEMFSQLYYGLYEKKSLRKIIELPKKCTTSSFVESVFGFLDYWLSTHALLLFCLAPFTIKAET